MAGSFKSHCDKVNKKEFMEELSLQTAQFWETFNNSLIILGDLRKERKKLTMLNAQYKTTSQKINNCYLDVSALIAAKQRAKLLHSEKDAGLISAKARLAEAIELLNKPREKLSQAKNLLKDFDTEFKKHFDLLNKNKDHLEKAKCLRDLSGYIPQDLSWFTGVPDVSSGELKEELETLGTLCIDIGSKLMEAL